MKLLLALGLAGLPAMVTREADITALIGDAACERQSDCHSIGVGAKACGGPSGYLAWSSRRTNQQELEAAVIEQAQAQREENKRSGKISNCMLTPDPGAVCKPRTGDGKRTCQAGQGQKPQSPPPRP